MHKYDTSGKETELIAYDSSGLLDYRETFKYDKDGNMAEKLHYDRDGSLTQRYTYKYTFDSFGNWVKRTRLMRVTKAGKSYWAPQKAYYRSITYY